MSLEFCFKRMQQRGIDTDALWANIVDVVCKSLYCVQDVIPWHPAAFELFGYDVLIDSDLKPWLIEVNSSPSLARDNPLDHEIKDALLRDVLAVVDAPAVDRTALKDVLQVKDTPCANCSSDDSCLIAAPSKRPQALVECRRRKISGSNRCNHTKFL